MNSADITLNTDKDDIQFLQEQVAFVLEHGSEFEWQAMCPTIEAIQKTLDQVSTSLMSDCYLVISLMKPPYSWSPS